MRDSEELAEREGFDCAISSKYSDYYYLRHYSQCLCGLQAIWFSRWSLHGRQFVYPVTAPRLCF
jgi:hypothetical protein